MIYPTEMKKTKIVHAYILKYLIFTFMMLSFITTIAGIKIEKDLAYADKGTRNLLDIYHNAKTSQPQDVIVFIHGGSWRSGSKDSYWFLGRNFAKKGKILVAINYPLAPEYQYDTMAYDCAKALKWVKENITKYGGNPDRIFVMGHSAGGHLAALINQDPKYFEHVKIKNPIKGVILNDAFGLNIYQYMKLQINTDDKYIPGFLQVFTKDEKEWEKASPIFTVENISNPYIMFSGSKTYESIRVQTPAFHQELKSKNKTSYYEIIKGKKHIGMLTQMIFGCNKMYDKIIDFIDKS
jgi:acetyl esterase/lipase